MHIEVLVEDSSGSKLVEIVLPLVIGLHGDPHTWNVHHYKGIGRIPQGLGKADPAKRILLELLPRMLQGYGRTPGIDAVVVVVDTDKRDCKVFLQELNAMLANCNPKPQTLFRLAIEEIEAWLLGDRQALLAAYPKAKVSLLNHYQQDSACDTWELLADAVYPGGRAALKSFGGPHAGHAKHEWAGTIGPRMNIESNLSPSFCKFRDGLRRLVND
jgi:hypothetical protein